MTLLMHNWFHGSRSYFGDFHASRINPSLPSENTSSLAKLLANTEVKEEMIKPVGYMRSEGIVHFLIPARVSSTRILIFLKTGIFFSI